MHAIAATNQSPAAPPGAIGEQAVTAICILLDALQRHALPIALPGSAARSAGRRAPRRSP